MCRRNVDNQTGTYLTIRDTLAMLKDTNSIEHFFRKEEDQQIILPDWVMGGSGPQFSISQRFSAIQLLGNPSTILVLIKLSSLVVQIILAGWIIFLLLSPTNDVLTRWQTGTPIQHRLCCKHQDLLRPLLFFSSFDLFQNQFIWDSV